MLSDLDEASLPPVGGKTMSSAGRLLGIVLSISQDGKVATDGFRHPHFQSVGGEGVTDGDFQDAGDFAEFG